VNLFITENAHSTLSGTDKQILAVFGFKLSIVGEENAQSKSAITVHPFSLKGYSFTLEPSEDVIIATAPINSKKFFVNFHAVGTSFGISLNWSSSQETKIVINEKTWQISHYSSSAGNAQAFANFSAKTEVENLYAGLDMRLGVHFAIECTGSCVRVFFYGPTAKNCTLSPKLAIQADKPLRELQYIKFGMLGTQKVSIGNLQQALELPNYLY